MKTLDEVITELEDEGLFPDALYYLKEYKIKRERIMAKAQDCENTEKRLQDEIAQYQEAVKNCELAENKYKKLVQDLATVDLPDGDHQQLEKARALLQDFYRNEPLTWGELKERVGKPVWITYEDCKGGWVIVGKTFSLFENDEPDAYIYMHYLKNKIECSKELYGSYWKAYRKELE